MYKQRPVISYYKSGNPTIDINSWISKLTDINIINTKTLTDEFIQVCVDNKDKIFLHLVITGMGKTIFEPNIDSVKTTFFQLKKLIDLGFPSKQILVIVNPILSNDNGLKGLELLLKVFTEFKVLRLRFVRFGLLQYKAIDDNKEIESHYTKQSKPTKFTVGNSNILKRQSTKTIMKYLFKEDTFFKNYYKLLKRYETIISIDKGEEPLIGVRELIPFGYNNSWNNPDGTSDKLIHYENGNKYKPIVNEISGVPIRCAKRCLLCVWKN